MVSENTNLKKIIKRLDDELDTMYKVSSGENIKREGTHIVIPPFMEEEDAAAYIMEYARSKNKEVSKTMEIMCHPDDGLVNFQRGVENTFGALVGRESMGFFGKNPAQARTVKIGYNEEITVPYGLVEVPGLGSKFSMQVGVDTNEKDLMSSRLIVSFVYKQKYQPLVEMIEQETKKLLREASIFREKAINSKFEFIDVSSQLLEKLVYSEYEERVLRANLFNIIENSDDVKAAGIPFKRTLLLMGRYGTGKTLTANKAAEVCSKNGWTFIAVVTSKGGEQDIVNALNFARRYEPCVVFFEDIDSVASGKRDEAINLVLNTVDGILSKDAEVLTILTTNNVERVERALLRPGRVDEIITLGELDEKSIVGLVKAYVGDNLEGELDAKKLLNEAHGYSPSFVAEAAKHALLFAVAERGATAKIQHQDVEDALKGLRTQFNLMEKKQVQETSDFEVIMSSLMAAKLAEFKQELNPKVLAVSA